MGTEALIALGLGGAGLGLQASQGGGGGGSTSTSNLSGAQRRLLTLLGGQYTDMLPGVSANLGAINQAGFGTGGLLEQLQRDTTPEAKAMSERIFKDSLLAPALKSFQRDIAPGIGASFGRIGGSLSSRRGRAISQGLSDVQTGAQAQLAAQLPAIHAFPLQQTLAQISGLGGLQGTQTRLMDLMNQFSLTGTRGQAMGSTPSGLGGDLLGAGALLGGSMLGGSGKTGGMIPAPPSDGIAGP